MRLLLLLVCTMAAACASRPAPSEHKGRSILVTDSLLDAGGTDTVRFGRLRSGEIAVLQLWLKNGAARPVAVASYDRICGCTTLEYDSRPIAPGAARRVSLSFDSRGQWGWQLKTLDISFAGGRRPLRLFVEAEVE